MKSQNERSFFNANHTYTQQHNYERNLMYKIENESVDR